MKYIIGLCGSAGSGKSTCANFLLKENFNLPFRSEEFTFSEPLKHACKALYGFSDEELYDRELKEKINPLVGYSPRQKLQWLGTDIIRKYEGEDFFVNIMKRKIEESSSSLFVISDVRFPNEEKMIRDYDGLLINISRREKNVILGKSEMLHSSENQMLTSNITIENDGTLCDLKKKIVSIVANYIQEKNL